MLPLSAREQIPFTPPGYPDGPAAPLYYLRVPTILTREQYKRARTALGIRPMDEVDLRNMLKAALPEFVTADDLPAALADIDLLASLSAQVVEAATKQELAAPAEAPVIEPAAGATPEIPAAPPTPIIEADVALMEELTAVATRVVPLIERVRREVPAYPQAEADGEYWWNMARTLAAQHFLAGWELPDGFAFEAGRDGRVTLECLSQLDPMDVYAIGLKALQLMTPTRLQRKN